MKAAVRLAFCAFGFLIFVSTGEAQFEKLQPPAYGMWAPQVGSGAVYQVETQGNTRTYELAIVSTESTSYGTGYWLEMRVTMSGQHVVATKSLVVESRRKLLTNLLVSQPSASKPEAILFDNTTSSIIKVILPGLAIPQNTPSDFRSGATRVGTESVSTAAGVFDCEVWRMKKGGAEVYYSSQVSPFGLVKVASKDGSVLLAQIVTDAKERMFVIPKAPVANTSGGPTVLYTAFPGVWGPVVGSGAAYELTRNGIKQEVEVTVVGSESRESETFHWLEVHAPCTGRGLLHFIYVPPEYGPPNDAGEYPVYPRTGERWDPVKQNHQHKGGCTNKILVTAGGLVASVDRAVFKVFAEDPMEARFDIPHLMQLPPGQASVTSEVENVSARLVEVRPSLPEKPESIRGETAPDVTITDFRKGAMLLGTEDITTRAGTFRCEHWRSVGGDTDVWLNSEIAPFGLVKKSNAAGELVLTKVIKNAQSRTKGIRSVTYKGIWTNSGVTIALRPRQ